MIAFDLAALLMISMAVKTLCELERILRLQRRKKEKLMLKEESNVPAFYKSAIGKRLHCGQKRKETHAVSRVRQYSHMDYFTRLFEVNVH